MISTFQRNPHFRKVLVNKTFTHVQEQNKAISAFRLHSVKCKITLMKQINLENNHNFFDKSIYSRLAFESYCFDDHA